MFVAKEGERLGRGWNAKLQWHSEGRQHLLGDTFLGMGGRESCDVMFVAERSSCFRGPRAPRIAVSIPIRTSGGVGSRSRGGFLRVYPLGRGEVRVSGLWIPIRVRFVWVARSKMGSSSLAWLVDEEKAREGIT